MSGRNELKLGLTLWPLMGHLEVSETYRKDNPKRTSAYTTQRRSFYVKVLLSVGMFNVSSVGPLLIALSGATEPRRHCAPA